MPDDLDESGSVPPRRGRRLRLIVAVAAAVAVIGGGAAAAVTVTRTAAPPAATADVPDGRDTATALTSGTWTRPPASPLGSPLGSILAWDGGELLQVGGGPAGTARTDAAAYLPAEQRWRALPAAPFAVTAESAVGIWTGQELLVVADAGAARFRPSSNSWRRLAAPPLAPGDRTAIRWGRYVVVTDRPRPVGSAAADPRPQLARYDPDADTWARLDPPLLPGHDPGGLAVAATDDGLVAWSLWSHSTSKPVRGGTMTTVAAE